jgi:hypothetical protein
MYELAGVGQDSLYHLSAVTSANPGGSPAPPKQWRRVFRWCGALGRTGKRLESLNR